MSAVATREDIDEVIGILQTFMQLVGEKFEAVDQRFQIIDRRFAAIDCRFDGINERLDGLDGKYDHLVGAVDSFIGRLETYEIESAARDNQFDKLLTWNRKVSVKTDIPLEDL